MEEVLKLAIHKLAKKHLLIIGKEENQRRKLVDQIIGQSNFETFRFPEGMKSVEEYIDFVKAKKLFKPWYSKKGKFNDNQILDFHRDWILENPALVVIEAFDEMEEAWRLDLLQSYLVEVAFRAKGQKVIHLIITQKKEAPLFSKLAEEIRVPEGDRRTKRQILAGSLEVIELE